MHLADHLAGESDVLDGHIRRAALDLTNPGQHVGIALSAAPLTGAARRPDRSDLGRRGGSILLVPSLPGYLDLRNPEAVPLLRQHETEVRELLDLQARLHE